MISSKGLKDIVASARPIIERQLDDAEMIAGLRDVVANAGGDWSALKALIKAQIQDERDESGDGKRVKKILDKAEFATGYADMLGWSKMNEKNFSAEDEFDPITGEFLDDETHQRPSTDDEPSPEAGPQAEASPAGTGSGTLADREGRHEGEAASVGLPANSPETANEMDREEMRVDKVGHSLPAEKGRKAIPAGPEGVDLNHAGAGESPAAYSKTDAAISRPGFASLDRPEIENRSGEEPSVSNGSGEMQDEATIHLPTNSEIAPASHGEAEAHAPKDISLPVDDRSGDGANTGGDHEEVVSGAPRAGQSDRTSNNGEVRDLPNSIRVLRPN